LKLCKFTLDLLYRGLVHVVLNSNACHIQRGS
jgi:hypothetical protein